MASPPRFRRPSSQVCQFRGPDRRARRDEAREPGRGGIESACGADGTKPRHANERLPGCSPGPAPTIEETSVSRDTSPCAVDGHAARQWPRNTLRFLTTPHGKGQPWDGRGLRPPDTGYPPVAAAALPAPFSSGYCVNHQTVALPTPRPGRNAPIPHFNRPLKGRTAMPRRDECRNRRSSGTGPGRRERTAADCSSAAGCRSSRPPHRSTE